MRSGYRRTRVSARQQHMALLGHVSDMLAENARLRRRANEENWEEPSVRFLEDMEDWLSDVKYALTHLEDQGQLRLWPYIEQ